MSTYFHNDTSVTGVTCFRNGYGRIKLIVEHIVNKFDKTFLYVISREKNVDILLKKKKKMKDKDQFKKPILNTS